ncbi:MAG: GTP 3',8-cyclase MoaA [Firmicutes bacterium]|nr:GTP 3',8-cyclase MoaA [Bacillota bacterium]
MQDTLGRKINYLRVSVTDLCNLRCMYCMPAHGVCKKDHDSILRIEEIAEIVKAAVELGINKVRLTGGEPLVRKGILDLVGEIGSIEAIKDFSMTTNGVLLKKYAQALKAAGLHRVNISLDTLNAEKYKYITRGGHLQDVLDGIAEAKRVGLLPLKINVVLIGGFNDDEITDFVELTLQEEVEIRFIELMPVGEASTWAKTHFLSNETVLEKFPDLVPEITNDKSSPAKYFKLPQSKGRVGLINPISNHFCGACNRLRVTADGKIKPCLHANAEIDIRKLLAAGKTLTDILAAAILQKPAGHKLNDPNFEPIERNMYQIGG